MLNSGCGRERRSRRIKIGSLLACLGFLALLTAPSATSAQNTPMPPFSKSDIPPAPDYEKASSWLAKPDDPDRFGVDIVWVYPTVLYDDPAWLMDITRKNLVAGAEESVATEARVFSGQANLYAPLYRQMNLAGFDLAAPERDALTSYGEDDVLRALRYYLKTHNNGRPFILAAHSQGSYVLTQLLLHHWGKIGIEDQLIAAYLVGWSITKQNLQQNPALHMCAEAHETGCIISYNSVAPGAQKSAPMILEGAVVVNPLTWSMDDAPAPASLNEGSTFFNKDGTSEVHPGFASAQIADGGLVVIPKNAKRLETPFFAKGVYHGYDYPLFFQNLQSNAAQRIQSYFGRPPGKN
jgi:hypothetical protein